ncbi:MAG: hypothetical protein KF813_03125 [Trueperaceae bacterium]|nr:hypothetical protein [Trueperaceae bacterium]
MLLIAAIPWIVFPRGAGPLSVTGPYGVAQTLVTLTDASRDETYGPVGESRRVAVGVWYPSGRSGATMTPTDTHPLVVFSHGSLGVLDSNESLYRELASHGYVVAAIGHAYQALFVTDTAGRTTWIDSGYLRELQGENAKADPAASLALYRKWLGVRMGDIGFVIDCVLDRAVAEVSLLVDPLRIAVVGHSLGGSAALGVGRVRRDVAAVVALEAPLLADLVGVVDGEFVIDPSPYPVPVLNVYSDDTWGRLSELPQYAGNVALLASREDVVAENVHIEGSRHLGLTDLALSSPLLMRLLGGGRQAVAAEEVLGEVNRLVVGFLGRRLGGVGGE